MEEPGDGDERSVLLGWLAFHRAALAAKCEGLAAVDLVALVQQCESLDAPGARNGRSVRWNLQKLVGEYSRHNGHADLLRERIDGMTGES